ncbi:putative phospholipase B-like 2 [Dermacentor albipictus]|uniref:putative phospholipase B-like 2 n=1 Tax=Dermacentor albipictus TaxID=60249 RepID=UPI0038FC84D4
MHTRKKDISQELRDSRYWASYNIAYFPDIFAISEQLPIVEQYGDIYTFENCPRAKIFRRDHAKVKDMDSMLKLMRYNDFKNDPLSICNCTPPENPTYAVAARYDLMDPQGTYDTPGMYRHAVGGIDAKVTSSSLFSSLEFIGVSGPTWGDQPPFQWSTSQFEDLHAGQPDKWQFEPVHRKWAEPRVQWRSEL